LASLSIKSSDALGAIASGICLIHCIATPFLFAVHAEFHHHMEQAHFTPLWWSSIDILFLVLSFYAVYFSSKQSNLRAVKIGLYSSWIGLAGIIVNEKFHLFLLAEWWIYIPSIALILLHLYNRKPRCRSNGALKD